MRDLFTGDFETRARRRRPHVQAHRRLPEEDLAAHGRAGHPLQGEGAAVRGLRRRRRDPLDAQPARRPPVRRLPRSSTTPRRSPSSTSTPAASSARARKTSGAPARGHDHEEQPRGGEGGRPPAPAARHRRDHRHRLHRHGEPEEPGDGRGGAADRARARPDEDVRRRDLAARPRRDDAAERHRRPARDPDPKCPTCGGDGIVFSEASAAIDVERRLRALAAGSRSQAFRVELSARASRARSSGPGRSGSSRSRR